MYKTKISASSSSSDVRHIVDTKKTMSKSRAGRHAVVDWEVDSELHCKEIMPGLLCRQELTKSTTAASLSRGWLGVIHPQKNNLDQTYPEIEWVEAALRIERLRRHELTLFQSMPKTKKSKVLNVEQDSNAGFVVKASKMDTKKPNEDDEVTCSRRNCLPKRRRTSSANPTKANKRLKMKQAPSRTMPTRAVKRSSMARPSHCKETAVPITPTPNKLGKKNLGMEKISLYLCQDSSYSPLCDRAAAVTPLKIPDEVPSLCSEFEIEMFEDTPHIESVFDGHITEPSHDETQWDVPDIDAESWTDVCSILNKLDEPLPNDCSLPPIFYFGDNHQKDETVAFCPPSPVHSTLTDYVPPSPIVSRKNCKFLLSPDLATSGTDLLDDCLDDLSLL